MAIDLKGLSGAAGRLGATVLTTYKADASDMRREMKKLRGEQRKLMKDMIEETEKQNRKLDDTIKKWASFTAAIIAVGKAWDFAKESIAVYQTNSRLAAAAGSTDIEALKRASKGLIRETDLLRLAAADQTSQMKLTQGQMENVVSTMARLINEGRNAEEVIRDFTQSVSEEGSEQLGKFGLEVVGAGKGVQSFNRLISESTRLGKDWSLAAGSEMAQAAVTWDDAVDNLAHSFGQLANELAPVISGLARVISLLGSIPDMWDRALSGDRTHAEELETVRKDIRKKERAQRFARRGQSGRLSDTFGNLGELVSDPLAGMDVLTSVGGPSLSQLRQREAELQALMRGDAIDRQINAGVQSGLVGLANLDAATRQALRQARAPSPAGAGRGRGAARTFAPSLAGPGLDHTFTGDPTFGFGAGGLPDLGGLGGHVGLVEADEARRQRQAEFRGQPAPSHIKGVTAGKLKDILQTAGHFQGASELISGAAGAAFSAWVTGSSSAGEAVKKFAGQFLLSKASMLAGEAVSSAVMALVSLGMGSPAAAQHFGKAAGMAAVGSATLLGMAKAMGAHGNLPNVPGAGVGSTGFGGRIQTTSNRTIILGDGVLVGSARQNAANVRRALDVADKEEGRGAFV